MKRNNLAKWTLPEVVDPSAHKCFKINVPDEKYHLAAFRGALLDLASAYKWADDPDHKAKDVANVWKQVILDMVTCDSALIPVACPYDFRFGDTAGWSPIIAGGITYAVYTGAGWQAGYTGQHGPPEEYYQLQIYHGITPSVVYSYTVTYTCLMPVTFNISPGFDTQGPYPGGFEQTVVVAAPGTVTDTLRIIMTTSPQSVPGSQIVVTKVIVNIANNTGSCS